MTDHTEYADYMATVALHDESGWWLGRHIESHSALTLLATISEDPQDWPEIPSFWPRYRTFIVPEAFTLLDFATSSECESQAAISGSGQWLFIDFVEKRICTGGGFPEVKRDCAYSMIPSEEDRKGSPLHIHLPPWWELVANTTVESMGAPREELLQIPRPHREILWGDAFVLDLSSRIVETFLSPAWQESDAPSNPHKRYPFTVAVHRDWLMTPREDLNGKMPRQCLHGAIDWIDSLCESQRNRIYSKEPCVAIPQDTHTYRNAPPGRDELGVYFDLCRELIEAGWDWCCRRNADAAAPDEANQLQVYLEGVRETWMNGQTEYGPAPQVVLECGRRRVPLGSGFEVVGLPMAENADDHRDCDCPICEMMADQRFGPTFSIFDGHHLELDDEFAFSMCETREQWLIEQGAYLDLYDDAESDEEQSTLNAEAPQNVERDEFASVWDGINTDVPPIGGSYLRLGFMLAEIISVLQRDDDAQQPEAAGATATNTPRELTKLLGDFRRADDHQKPAASDLLKKKLESLTDQIPELTPRVADFQSHLDELLMTPRTEFL